MPPAPPSPAAGSSRLPPVVRAAVDALHAHLALELGRRIEATLSATQRELHHRAQASRGPILEAHWHGNLQRLGDHRSRLLPRLLADLRETLEALRDPPPPSALAPAPTAGRTAPLDLRLVEETELDEAGLLDELGRRQEARAGLPLLLLGQRFGVLAAAPAFTASSLPVGARALAKATMEAATELQLDDDARKLLLRAFEREALADYPAMADSMNAVLNRAGVLPGLTYVPLRPRPASAPPPPRAQGGRDHGDAADAAPPPATLSEDRRMAQMRQWMAERRYLLSRLSGNADRVQAPTLGTQELDNVLAALQVGPVVSRSTARLRQAVHEQSRRMGTEAVPGGEQADSLALFGDLYMRLQERVHPSAQTLVAGLQMPLLRLALQDPGFLVRPSAPPRKLLATVTEATAAHHGSEGLDPQLLERIEEVVRELAMRYPHAPETFEEACSALEEPLAAALRRAEIAERRNVEAARGRERLLSARRSAAAALEWSIGDQELPRFQRSLLEQPWTDALAMVALRHGTGSQQWHEHMETTAAISHALRGGEPAGPEHAARIREALGLIGYHPEQASAIAGYLTAAGSPDADAASRTELALEMKERTRLGGRGDDPGPRPGREGTGRRRGEQEWESRLASLPQGQWLEFDAADHPGGIQRLRLAWTGPDSGRVLLLNARGHPPAHVPTRTLPELASLLAAGTARLLGDQPPEVLEQAWRALVAELQPRGAQEPADGEARS